MDLRGEYYKFFKPKDNLITKKGLEILKESIINNEHLKKINLSRKKIIKKKENNFSKEEFMIISEIIKKSKLDTIYLGGKIYFKKDNTMSEIDLYNLKQSIIHNDFLKTIDLSCILNYYIKNRL
jgi:hypothetical protein